MSKVDVEKYWLSRGRKYFFEPVKWSLFRRRRAHKQEAALIDFLKTLNFESVFEVGCGYGRITKLILENFPQVRQIVGIDLSPDQIEIAQRYVNSRKVELRLGKIQDVEVPDRSYDVVIAVSVLMHIPFNEVNVAIKSMVRISRKHVVNVDWYRPTMACNRGYCFAHDYPSLYKKFGCKKIRRIPIPMRPEYGISVGLDSGLRIFRKKAEIQCIWHAMK